MLPIVFIGAFGYECFKKNNLLTLTYFFCNEIYKGNSEKYKRKMKNQDISVFGPKHNFVEYTRWLAAFLGS